MRLIIYIFILYDHFSFISSCSSSPEPPSPFHRYVLAHMRDLARLSLYSSCSLSPSPWTEHTASSNTQATSHPAQPQDHYCESCKQIAIDSCARHQLIPMGEVWNGFILTCFHSCVLYLLFKLLFSYSYFLSLFSCFSYHYLFFYNVIV